MFGIEYFVLNSVLAALGHNAVYRKGGMIYQEYDFVFY
jgi:hypothetical protein